MALINSVGNALIASAFLLLLVSVVSCLPVAADRWTMPCGVPSPTTSLPKANLTRLLKTDAHDILLAASELKTFTISRIGPDAANSLDVWNAHMENFPYNYVPDQSGILTADLLKTDYKYLSRMAIYLEKMIDNELVCAVSTTGKAPMDKVMNRVYAMLCHVQQRLGLEGQQMTSYETRDAVLSNMIKNFYPSCITNDSNRQAGDYVVARDSITYTSNLFLQYTKIVASLDSNNSSG